MQWLKDEGIELVNLGSYGTNVLSPPWRTGFGLTWQNYGADIALQRLEANFQKRQGRILRGTPRPRADARFRRHRDRGGTAGRREEAQRAVGGDRRRRLPGQPRHAAPKRRFAGAGKAPGAKRRDRRGRRPSHGAGPRRRAERRHEQLLRPSAQPRRHAEHQALAAAGHRRSRRGGHRHRRRGPALHRRGARRHLDLQRHRPPARPARHHDHLRPGDLGGPARPQPRAAAQSAGGRGRRHLASRRHARGAGRRRSDLRRSG